MAATAQHLATSLRGFLTDRIRQDTEMAAKLHDPAASAYYDGKVAACYVVRTYIDTYMKADEQTPPLRIVSLPEKPS